MEELLQAIESGEPVRPKLPFFPPEGFSLKTSADEVLSSWSFVRRNYPGWLITPSRNRHQLWSQTEAWISLIFRQVPDLPPTVALEILFELNWRLERCMVPLFVDWVSIIESVLNKEEFESVGSENTSLFEKWISLVFAVTREAREDFEGARHKQWMERLEKHSHSRAEWNARFHYEKCLFALWRLNEPEVREAVEKWIVPSELLKWQIRRASILTEIGDFSDAERILSSALRRIRSELHGPDERIDLMSLEGWAMKSLQAVLQGSFRSAEYRQLDRFRDRWFQLAAFRCDPSALIDDLEAEIQALDERGQTDERSNESITFDYTITHSITADYDRLSSVVPAFAQLRLFEDAGLPVRAGPVIVIGSELEKACRVVFPYAPYWAPSMLIRAGRSNVLHQLFDRKLLRGLSGNEIQKIRAWLETAFKAAKTVSAGAERLNTPDGSFRGRVIQEALELMSRLSVRSSDAELDELFELAIEVHLLSRTNESLHKSSRLLFERLFAAAEPSKIRGWLPRLLQLPIISEEEAKGKHEHFLWPDPVEVVLDSLDHGFVKKTKLPRVDKERVLVWLSQARSSVSSVRNRSLLRLYVLFELGQLTAAQVKSFGSALWSKIDPSTSLPASTSFRPHAFLNLPAPNRAVVMARVRRFLLSRPIPDYVEEKTENGKKFLSYTMHGQENKVLSEIIYATRNPLQKPSITTIDWSLAETHLLLRSVSDWWNRNKIGMDDDSFTSDLPAAAEKIVDFLAVLVFPRLPRFDVAGWMSADGLRIDLDAHGVHTEEALPSRLIRFPEQSPAMAILITRALREGKKSGVAASAEALLNWCKLHVLSKIPPPPKQLLSRFFERVGARQQPALREVLWYAAMIVAEASVVLTEPNLDEIYFGLGYLLDETESQTPKNRNVKHFLKLPQPELTIYRRAAAKLAYEVYNLLLRDRRVIPPILTRWKEAAESDPLPEIRACWRCEED